MGGGASTFCVALLDDGLHLPVGGRPFRLLFASNLIARHVVEGRNPLHGFCRERQEQPTGRCGQCPCLIEGSAGRTRHP